MIKTELQIKAMKRLYDDGTINPVFFRDQFPAIYETLIKLWRVQKAAKKRMEHGHFGGPQQCCVDVQRELPEALADLETTCD